MRSSPRSLCRETWIGAGAVIALACSVYEVPEVAVGAAGSPAEGGTTAGSVSSSGNPSVGSSVSTSGSGGSATDGGMGASAGEGAVGSGGGSVGGSASGGPGEAGEAGEAGASGHADTCPNDPDKLEPGMCGCGVPDVATATLAACSALKAKLLHRYDFEGNGTAVVDRVGTAHGAVRGANVSKLEGRGVVLLGGGTAGPYIDLPNGLISALTNATFEAWITWGGGNAWQRVFDFGDSTHATPENNPASGKSYLFLTPKTGGSGGASLTYSAGGSAQEIALTVAQPLPLALTQIVAVVNDAGNQVQLYVDGELAGSAAWTGALGQLNDVNVWLGRSQFDGDPELSGVYHDFRVYGAALSAAEVASAFRGGTDPVFMAY